MNWILMWCVHARKLANKTAIELPPVCMTLSAISLSMTRLFEHFSVRLVCVCVVCKCVSKLWKWLREIERFKLKRGKEEVTKKEERLQSNETKSRWFSFVFFLLWNATLLAHTVESSTKPNDRSSSGKTNRNNNNNNKRMKACRINVSTFEIVHMKQSAKLTFF